MAGQGNLTGTPSPTGQRPNLIGPPPWCKMQCDPVRIVGVQDGEHEQEVYPNLLQILGLNDYGGGSHGFRSSFRDWAAEETDHPREVIEAALAHVVRNRTEAAYARSDLFERRRRLMDDWLAYLDGECRADTGPGSDPYLTPDTSPSGSAEHRNPTI